MGWGKEGEGWGAEGGSRGQAALRPGGALQCGWDSCLPVFHLRSPQPPTQGGSEGVREPRYTPRPLPAGGAGLALIGAGGGRGRRELARGSVSIRDAKFLLREETTARAAWGS